MNVIFHQPEWSLLLLAAIAFAILYFFLYRHKKSICTQFTTLFSTIPTNTSPILFWQRALCLIFAWILLACALMQPATPIKPGTISVATPAFHEIAFLLDDSQSMAVMDTSTKASRFDRAKELIELTVEHLGGIPISLYTFAGDAVLQCPPTVDYLYFLFILRGLIVNDTAVAGTDFATVANTLQARYKDREKTLFILFSDGEDTIISDDAALRLQEEDRLAKRLIKSVHNPASRFETVGIGSLEGAAIPGIEVAGNESVKTPIISKLRPHLLKMIAQDGKGRYLVESDLTPKQITKELYIEAVHSSQQAEGKDFRDLSRYPAFFALLFLAIGLLMPERRAQ